MVQLIACPCLGDPLDPVVENGLGNPQNLGGFFLVQAFARLGQLGTIMLVQPIPGVLGSALPGPQNQDLLEFLSNSRWAEMKYCL